MAQKTDPSNRLKNSSGFTTLGVLLVGVVVSIFVTASVAFFEVHNKFQARARTVEEAANLATAVKMVLSNPDACKQNLVSHGFGTTISELRSKSAAGTLQVLYPTANGPAGAVAVSPNADYFHLAITSLKFLEKGFDATTQAFDMDLQITVKDALSELGRPITIPFVITPDGSGNLASCYATSYAPSASGQAAAANSMSLESFLCSRIESGTVYSQQQKSCVPIATQLVGN